MNVILTTRKYNVHKGGVGLQKSSPQAPVILLKRLRIFSKLYILKGGGDFKGTTVIDKAS